MTRLALALLVVASACTCRTGGAGDAGPDADWLSGRPGADRGTPKRGGTLAVRLPLEPNGLTRLHDRFAEGTMVRITVGPIYETLARARADRLEPLLAERWVESGDHLTLTVTLREGVRFHDGALLTSADVKATLALVMDPAKATSSFRASLETVSSVDAPDPRTVVVHFSRPYFLATHTLLAALPVMPAHALQGDFDTLPIHRAPIGTGPFKFERWEPGVSLSYVRADDRAHLDRVIFRFLKDDGAALQAFEKGELGLFVRVPPASWRALETQPWAWRDARRLSFEENAYAWIGFNQRLPLFQDVRVRRALAMLYPAEQIEKVVDLGLEPRTTCPYFGESCDPTVRPLPFDVAGAKRLLAEAGWGDSDGDGVLDRGGARLSFSFLAAAQSPKMQKLLPIFLDTLMQAGVEARIESVDVSAYMSRVRAHDFEAMALSWSSGDAVVDLFPTFHSSQAAQGNDYVGYASPQVDALLERIRGELDPARRRALEREVHRRLFEDQAYLFMGRRPSLDLARRNVHGLVPASGWYDLAAVWIEG
ncbi:MAG: ABC transporter substrate-binding protein [Myxococcota bacterium]